MGYYTNYDIDYVPNPDSKDFDSSVDYEPLICQALAEINPDYFGDFKDDPQALLSDFFWDELKWYDHEDNMLELSKRFPELIFTLCGEGEDHDDNWREFFYNGAYEICTGRIIFDEPKNEIFKEVKFRS